MGFKIGRALTILFPNPPKNPQFESQHEEHKYHALKPKVYFPKIKTKNVLFTQGEA